MTPTQQHATLAAANCEVAFDNLTRQLYATDASHYQIEPIAVAFPRDARQASPTFASQILKLCVESSATSENKRQHH